MALADELERAARRADDDQPRAVQRRGAARGTRRRDHPDRAALRPQQLRGADHDGTLEIGGAVEQPDHAHPRRPARDAGGRARRHARMRRERAPRDAAAAGRRAMGRLRRLDRPLEGRAPARGARAGEAARTGVEVRFDGADHGSYILNPVLKNIDASDLSFERSLTLVHAADPAAEILIAYEMNGEPLNPDHGARSG